MIGHTMLILLMAAALAPLIVLAAPTSEPTATQASGPNAVPPSRQPDREIVYKKTPQGDLKLFIYLPPDWKATDKRPAMLFFFGGGWRIGNASQFFSKAEYFASRGMVAISAEYRISSVHQTGVKECVVDARSAMRYLRKHAGELGVNPEQIVSGGGSAGGHLAAALTFPGPDDPADDLSISCRPQAMVLFNPVIDLIAAYEDPKTADVMRKCTPGDTEDERRKFLHQYSPIDHLEKNLPPAILFYGDQDHFYHHAQVYAEKSAALGNKVELFHAEGVGHGFFNKQPLHNATLIDADKFLATLGILKGPPTIQRADAATQLHRDTVTAAR